MAEQVLVELLDQNWTRKAITAQATSVRFTEELGQVGEGSVEILTTDPAASFLPNPDATNPYEGRFRIYEDNDVVFAGVIDAKQTRLSHDGSSITFGGKQRGVELGFKNLGRFDYLGWQLQELLTELTRDNIAKQSVLVSATTQEELFGAYQMVTGDPHKANYWKSTASSGTHTATFDLGSSRTVNAIRVMPQWWKDADTNKFHWHKFTIQTSPDNSTWTTRGTKDNTYPSSAKGHLYTFTDDIRYFRINVTGSTDGYARIAQILVYQDIVSIGSDTTYTTPFIENDDSGNVALTGSPTRPIVPGAFQGDSVITHSYVTRMNASGQRVTQTFRGVSSAVFFTSHNNGSGVADIYVAPPHKMAPAMAPQTGPCGRGTVQRT